MISFLTGLPVWLSGLLLVGLTTVLAMVGPRLVRRYATLKELTANNEVAGFKFAVVGVLYAVLLAFAIIVVWEKFNDAESMVAREAGATANIYRLSQGLGDGPGSALRKALGNYLKVTIAEDWPAMERGGESEAARRALDQVYAALLPSIQPQGGPITAEILHQLDVVTQERRARIVAADGTVPGILWPVLFWGAAITIGFTYFFGTQSLRAQTLMTGLLSVLIFSPSDHHRHRSAVRRRGEGGARRARQSAHRVWRRGRPLGTRPTQAARVTRHDGRRGTMSFEVSTCTTSPRWLRASLLKTGMPRSDLEREGVISSTSLTTCSSSPGRTGRGHLTPRRRR